MTPPALDAYVYDAVRTPRGAGKETGALRGVKPIDLLATLYRALLERSSFPPAAIEDVVLGCSAQVGEQGANLAKISALHAGLPDSVSGVTLNRFCASGLDAVATAALKVSSGFEELVIAGGVECSSRVPLFSDAGSWFTDPEVARSSRFVHMGVAADVVATLEGITREECDAYALASHRRAARARDDGHFARSLVPVIASDGRTVLDRDECIRDAMTLEKLRALPAAFVWMGAAALPLVQSRYPGITRIDPVHHVGSAPAVADGASLLLVGSRRAGERYGLEPRARIRSLANVSVEPIAMLLGAVPATRKALRATGLETGDVDLFECNESFAATVLAFQRGLGVENDRVNVDGGAIAMGHPLGATGGMLIATLCDALDRRGGANQPSGRKAVPGPEAGRIGVATICAGAGIAAAVVLERCRS